MFPLFRSPPYYPNVGIQGRGTAKTLRSNQKDHEKKNLTNSEPSSTQSKSLQNFCSWCAVHSLIISPDFIPDPGILESLGSEELLNLLQTGGMITDMVDSVVGDGKSLAVMVVPTHG